ncbi:hypothetical protein LPN04_29680 [Rugamonas sp. A1-17]|nr:hypothetical protein [Rugamonas sp. A1-17]
MIGAATGPSPARDVTLLAIVEVDKADSVVCQAEGCGRSVYKQIHVVLDAGEFVVLGSGCFKHLYGHSAIPHMPHWGSGTGRRLTDEERVVLQENTARFVEYIREKWGHIENVPLPVNASALHRGSGIPVQPKPNLAQAAPNAAWDYPSPGAEDYRFDGAAGMHWMWSRSILHAKDRIERFRLSPEFSKFADLVLRYAQQQPGSDPWKTALGISQRHGIPQAATMRVWYDMALIELLPAYNPNLRRS